jgi:hypothetical protein
MLTNFFIWLFIDVLIHILVTFTRYSRRSQFFSFSNDRFFQIDITKGSENRLKLIFKKVNP